MFLCFVSLLLFYREKKISIDQTQGLNSGKLNMIYKVLKNQHNSKYFKYHLLQYTRVTVLDFVGSSHKF